MNRTVQALLLGACLATGSLLPAQEAQPQRWIHVIEDFTRGASGWLAGYSDYQLAQGGMQREAEVRPLPVEAGVEGSGYFLRGNNNSDDLFMYLRKPLDATDGIEPGGVYDVEFLIEFLSNEPTGCTGVGGSSGDSVYLKAGASTVEPVTVLDGENVWINVDKGQQSVGGPDASVTGTIGNGLPCEDANRRYVPVERRHHHPDPVQADANGNLWLIIGTDSAYEGYTALYYSRIVVLLTLVEGGAR